MFCILFNLQNVSWFPESQFWQELHRERGSFYLYLFVPGLLPWKMSCFFPFCCLWFIRLFCFWCVGLRVMQSVFPLSCVTAGGCSLLKLPPYSCCSWRALLRHAAVCLALLTASLCAQAAVSLTSPFADGHLGLFQSFAITSVAMNNNVHLSSHVFARMIPLGVDFYERDWWAKKQMHMQFWELLPNPSFHWVELFAFPTVIYDMICSSSVLVT